MFLSLCDFFDPPQAIVEVGEVIQFYDSDRRFPAWGFGGRTADGHVSHAFNLNGALYGDEVVGVEGIMSAYSSALANVALAGPTLFSHVVDKAAHTASQSLSQNSPKYFVLLIITDGVLTDMAGTIDALVRASDLPLSVLIVGVGNTDFTQMEILDADKGRRLESSTGRVATRDIVQFVPMKDVHSGQVSVVQALLEELPGQFLSYVRCRNINPILEKVGRYATDVVISADGSWKVLTEDNKNVEAVPEATQGDPNSFQKLTPTVLDLTNDENEMETSVGTQFNELKPCLPEIHNTHTPVMGYPILNQSSASVHSLPQLPQTFNVFNGQQRFTNFPQVVNRQDSAAREASYPQDRLPTNTSCFHIPMPTTQSSQFQGSHVTPLGHSLGRASGYNHIYDNGITQPQGYLPTMEGPLTRDSCKDLFKD
ncbi:hypothetical protein F2Q69_00063657 [Brassica cretica]|uniref:Copine C-terminal domain-containing protein n=1 Tax=Brassica cretica TaxID=69181 RepID=A0A8S9RG08_BRACR|nr:hypothetical protein F2Q69_00063657 [Brassica cretica]